MCVRACLFAVFLLFVFEKTLLIKVSNADNKTNQPQAVCIDPPLRKNVRKINTRRNSEHPGTIGITYLLWITTTIHITQITRTDWNLWTCREHGCAEGLCQWCSSLLTATGVRGMLTLSVTTWNDNPTVHLSW